MNWKIQKIDLDRKKDLIEFFKSYIWKKKNGHSLYEWKYEKNPAGTAQIWGAISEDNTLVGTYMMVPWNLKYQDKVLKGTQCIDALTDKNYRGQGMYPKLGAVGIKHMESGYSPLSFAFPNPIAVSGHIKVGWIRVGTLQRWVKVLACGHVIEKVFGHNKFAAWIGSILDAIRKPFLSEYWSYDTIFEVNEVTRFNHEFDELWERVKDDYGILIVKNSAYLNWKYFDSPTKARQVLALRKEGVLEGFAVIEKGSVFGHIVDILSVRNTAVINILLTEISKYFLSVGIQAISFVALEDHFTTDMIKKFGFRLRKEKNAFMAHINSKSVDKDYVGNPSNWEITIGDCDVETLN